MTTKRKVKKLQEQKMETHEHPGCITTDELRKHSARKPIKGKAVALRHVKTLEKEYTYLLSYIKKHFPDDYDNGFAEHARGKVDMYLGILEGYVEEDGDPCYHEARDTLEEQQMEAEEKV